MYTYHLWNYRWNSHSCGKYLSKKATLVVGDFSNRKKLHNIVLQAMCDANKIFWNVCVGKPRVDHDNG
jgi:hypothetical protein